MFFSFMFVFVIVVVVSRSGPLPGATDIAPRENEEPDNYK